MTREEAKSMWIDKINVSGKVQYFSIIDCVYNAFESRTCGNCKRCLYDYNGFKMYCNRLQFIVSDKWFCADWESKND